MAEPTKVVTATNNPANVKDAPKRKRIPMSTPVQRLEVPEREGYHRHWFLESRVPRALQGGYDFVKADSVTLNSRSIGTNNSISGNTDLGSNVTVAGDIDENGVANGLVLMEIPEEFWLEDQKAIAERNAAVLQGIFREEKILGSEQQSPQDQKQNYVKTALFNRRARKG